MTPAADELIPASRAQLADFLQGKEPTPASRLLELLHALVRRGQNAREFPLHDAPKPLQAMKVPSRPRVSLNDLPFRTFHVHLTDNGTTYRGATAAPQPMRHRNGHYRFPRVCSPGQLTAIVKAWGGKADE